MTWPRLKSRRCIDAARVASTGTGNGPKTGLRASCSEVAACRIGRSFRADYTPALGDPEHPRKRSPGQATGTGTPGVLGLTGEVGVVVLVEGHDDAAAVGVEAPDQEAAWVGEPAPPGEREPQLGLDQIADVVHQRI